MTNKSSIMIAGMAFFALLTLPALAVERHTLKTQVPEAAAHLPKLGRLPATNRMQLAIGLPLRNRDILTNLLQQLYDRRSTNFHNYLTPAQFTEQFGPTEQDYQMVMDYAKSNRLEVVCTFNNRALVDVAGSVADIEKTFHVNLSLYQHPTENRRFYAPDVDPSIDVDLPITYVVGLNNYFRPKPRVRRLDADSLIRHGDVDNGTGTKGLYLGNDFRHAYAPGVTNTGTGQIVGLFEFVGYTTSDITNYEFVAGLPNVPLQNVVMPGASGLPNTSANNNDEIALDIEMVASMAPGLSKILVVEAYTGVDGMNQLASTNNGVPLANQVSSSWGFSEGVSLEPQLMEMAAQGQSFFLASGDSGAPTNGIQSGQADDNYATMVGGSELTMTNPGVAWQSEQVWDYQFATGASTGYIETALPIPAYQQGINTSANGGSTIYRNVPDVAMCADYIEIICTVWNTNNTFSTGSIQGVGGTSAAAPLWAAFTALVNEQAASQGKPTVGFINPALYEIAQRPSYASCFHDITAGNNTNTYSVNLFHAGPGYDNCTGLGTPAGGSLINALVGLSGPVFVDFNYNGAITDGSFPRPFKTLAEGTNAVSTGGTIFIITGGSSSETMTINKPMTITAEDGGATIGN